MIIIMSFLANYSINSVYKSQLIIKNQYFCTTADLNYAVRAESKPMVASTAKGMPCQKAAY